MYLVPFDRGSSDITNAAKLVIDLVIADYNVGGHDLVTVTGHYDRSGTDEYAAEMSRKMAENVRAHLIAGGIPARSIKIDWRGETEPAIPTRDGVVESGNRRVEIQFPLPEN